MTGGPGPEDPREPIERLLRPDVVPLAPPAGRFDQIAREARRRRRMRVLPALAAATVLAVAVTGGALALHDRTGGISAAAPTTQPSTGPAPSDSALPSSVAGGPSSSDAGTAPTTGAQKLPPGGPVPAGFDLRSVSTASADVVYALGTAPCNSPVCTSLARSTDRGQTWVGLRPPRARLAAAGDPPSRDAVRDVRFASARDGWLYGGGLWSTHDGSARTDSWNRVDVGGTVLDLAADSTSVWVVVADCSASACSDPRLLVSATATDRFRPVPGVSAHGGVQADGARLDVVGGSAAVVLSLTNGSGNAGQHAWVMGPDGTWRGVPAGAPCKGVQVPDGIERLVPSGDHDRLGVVAFCSDGAGAGSAFFRVARSADGGSTWTLVPGRGLRLTNGPEQSFAVMSMDLLAAASGGNPDLGGGIAVSSDGGRTWTTADVSRPSAGWRYLGAAGGRRLLALPEPSEGSLWVSTDAGVTWAAYPVR